MTDFSGVYCILNKKTKQRYVGSATRVMNRISVHEWALENAEYPGSHRLMRDWQKLGAENFEFVVLEACHRRNLVMREQFWIDKFDSKRHGYNKRDAGFPTGWRASKSTRQKMSRAAKIVGSDPRERVRRAERARAQHANGNFGQATWTDETRKTISKKLKGRPANENSLQGLRAYWADPANRLRQSVIMKEIRRKRRQS